MELIVNQPIALSASTPVIVVAPVPIGAETESIIIRLRRATSLSPLAWVKSAKLRITISVMIDGIEYICQGSTSGGIRKDRFGADAPEYTLTYGLPVVMTPDGARRIGQIGKNITASVRVERLGGDISSEILSFSTTEAPPPIWELRHSVAYDTASSASEEYGDGVVSVTHTTSVIGSNVAAFAGVTNYGGPAYNGAVTFNAVAMTELWDTVYLTEHGGAGYRIAGQATGAKTVTSTLTGSPGQQILGVISMTEVHQTTPVGTAATATGTTNAPSVTSADAAADDLVVDNLAAFSDGAATVGASQTQRYGVVLSALARGHGSTQAGVDGGVMSWSIGAGTIYGWILGAVAFKPAAAGGAAQSVADTATLSEKILRQIGHLLKETLSLTEKQTRQVAHAMAESKTFTEAQIRQVQRNLVEAVSFVETVRRQTGKSLPELLSFVEAETRQVAKCISDGLTPAEAITRQILKRTPDNLVPTESLIASLARLLNLSESVSPTEALRRFIGKTIAEGFTPTEAIKRQTGRNLTELLTVAEAMAKSIQTGTTESLAFSENLLAELAGNLVSLVESLAFVESQTRRMGKGLADLLTFTEDQTIQVQRTLAETLALSEHQIIQVRRLLAEGVSLTDALQRRTGKTLAELLSLAEAQRRETWKRLAETLGLSETLLSSLVRLLDLGDTASFVEALARQIQTILAESLGITEDLGRDVRTTLLESLGVTESLVRLLARMIAEDLGLTEALAELYVAYTGILRAEYYRMTELPDRYAFAELPDRYVLTELPDRYELREV